MKVRILLLIIIIVLSSCPFLEDKFEPYRGTNLIAGADYSTAVPDGAADVYLSFAPAAETYNGSQAYVLTYNNLFPDGMFESGITNWTGTNTTPAYQTSDPNLINGGTMVVDIAVNNALVQADLHTLTDSLENGTYNVKFLYRADSTIRCQVNADPSYSSWSSGGGDGGSIDSPSFDNLNSFPPPDEFLEGAGSTVFAITNAAGTNQFNFGLDKGSNSQIADTFKAYIDDFRIVRTDQYYFLQYDIAGTHSAALPLVSGMYRFSLYIKNNPAAGSNNVFDSNSITMQLTAINKDLAPATARTVFHEKAGGWDSWTKVYVDMTVELSEEYPPEGSASPAPLFQLSVSPVDFVNGGEAVTAGSLLVSSPSFELFPDGYPEN